jgi:hypothetical protein
MPSKGSAPEQEAVAQLAQLIINQRGEKWSQRRLQVYAAALKQRMSEIRAHQRQELTGAELFRTIACPVPAAWEDVPEEQQALYNAAVRNFLNEKKAEREVPEQEHQVESSS